MAEGVIQDFLSYLNLQKRFSPHTVKNYQLDLQEFFNFVSDKGKNDFDVSEISYQHIRGYIANRMEAGISAKSANRKLSTLKSFFKHALKNNLVKENPTQKVKAPKIPKKLPVFIDQTQTDYLFSSYTFKADFEGVRDKLLMDILYQCGIRRAELLGLKENDVDIYNLQLKVLGKRNKERVIPFDYTLKRSLENYLREKSENKLTNAHLLVTLQNKPLNASQVGKIVFTVLSGVTTAKKKSPHVLRHTFATHLLNNGADINAVKELLGHTSLAATQIYTHNTIDKLKKMYNQAHPRSGN
ncbi:MAG: tyrosine-type recombinase/integrase [Bacteroidetes bacterium]|nr:tyrosine-type recombinase/integrase [Bacteroidota bacterium]